MKGRGIEVRELSHHVLVFLHALLVTGTVGEWTVC